MSHLAVPVSFCLDIIFQRRLPDGHVFMMGDNRDHSFDSRAWGPVPLSNVLGRSLFVWFSWGREGMAWDRLGTWLE